MALKFITCLLPQKLEANEHWDYFATGLTSSQHPHYVYGACLCITVSS